MNNKQLTLANQLLATPNDIDRLEARLRRQPQRRPHVKRRNPDPSSEIIDDSLKKRRINPFESEDDASPSSPLSSSSSSSSSSSDSDSLSHSSSSSSSSDNEKESNGDDEKPAKTIGCKKRCKNNDLDDLDDDNNKNDGKLDEFLGDLSIYLDGKDGKDGKGEVHALPLVVLRRVEALRIPVRRLWVRSAVRLIMSSVPIACRYQWKFWRRLFNEARTIGPTFFTFVTALCTGWQKDRLVDRWFPWDWNLLTSVLSIDHPNENFFTDIAQQLRVFFLPSDLVRIVKNVPVVKNVRINPFMLIHFVKQVLSSYDFIDPKLRVWEAFDMRLVRSLISDNKMINTCLEKDHFEITQLIWKVSIGKLQNTGNLHDTGKLYDTGIRYVDPSTWVTKYPLSFMYMPIKIRLPVDAPSCLKNIHAMATLRHSLFVTIAKSLVERLPVVLIDIVSKHLTLNVDEMFILTRCGGFNDIQTHAACLHTYYPF